MGDSHLNCVAAGANTGLCCLHRARRYAQWLGKCKLRLRSTSVGKTSALQDDQTWEVRSCPRKLGSGAKPVLSGRRAVNHVPLSCPNLHTGETPIMGPSHLRESGKQQSASQGSVGRRLNKQPIKAAHSLGKRTCSGWACHNVGGHICGSALPCS